MNACRQILAIVLASWANVATAELPTLVADFEASLPVFGTHDTMFGGAAIVQLDHGVGIQLEQVKFTSGGVTSESIPANPGFPTSLSIPGNQFVAHGSPTIASYVPTDTRGLYLQLGVGGRFSRIGDLFDLVSIDGTSYVRSGSTTRDYGATRLQFNTQANPLPYTRRTATGGWILAGSAGTIVDEPPALKFETIPLADSPIPVFPAEQFRGMRSAFIGYDEVRALDNIRVRWSRENFAAPATVEIVEQELSGDGLVVDGTAVYHRPSIETFGDDGPITLVSTERRVFRWSDDTLLGDEFPLRVAGELEFDYVVENGGQIQIDMQHTFKRLGGGLSGSGGSGRTIRSIAGRSETGTVLEMTQQFLQTQDEFGAVRVTPGADYEVTTTLTLTVDPRGGHAAAFFDRGGWEVRIAGELVPEPAGAGMIAVGAVLWGGRRRRRLAGRDRIQAVA